MVGGFPKRFVPPPEDLPPVEFLKPDRPPVDDVLDGDDDDKPVLSRPLVPLARPWPKMPPPLPPLASRTKTTPDPRHVADRLMASNVRPTRPVGGCIPVSQLPQFKTPSENLTKLSRPAARDVNGKPTTLNPDDIPY